MDIQTDSQKDLNLFKKIVVKKDGLTYEISADRKISDLLNLILPLNIQNESFQENSNAGLKSNKQNFIFQISQNNGIKIKSVFKEEFLSGKSELEELKHPFFSNTSNPKLNSTAKLIKITDEMNIDNYFTDNVTRTSFKIQECVNSENSKTDEKTEDKKKNRKESTEASIKDISNSITNANLSNEKNKQTLSFEKTDKILVFSPHPDDEILGACGLIYKCFTESYNIKVVYMTSGKGGGQAETRKKEAIEGIRKLGGSEKHLIFTNMPFYEKADREVTEDDYIHATNIINEEKPTSIFICSDIFDPNGTHRKCYDILLDLFKSKKFVDIKFYFYYSVWYWPKANEYSHILPYEYETYKMKIYAMLEHKSQLANKFMGGDPRPFYQRATTRDGHYGNIHNSDFCEVYYLINNHIPE